MRYIDQCKIPVTEGILRSEELLAYLGKMKAPLHVWLAEDASGVVTKIEYDARSNQLVGLTLPINQNDGFPIALTFMPKSAAEIENYMKEPMSSHVYIVMAQPIVPNVPPFILQVFGTNNKFKTHDVIRRWHKTIEELAK